MKLFIKITPDELLNKGIWIKLCELRGWNPWMIQEGICDKNEELELTYEEALELNIINEIEEII